MASKQLLNKAITAALEQDWHEAIEINLEILETDPFHIPTLNRLAKAYREIGMTDKAIATYEQALKYDRYNQIAQKNIRLLKTNSHSSAPTPNCTLDTCFVDEPGKTKTLPLTRLGNPNLIQRLQAGQIVHLKLNGHSICITNDTNEHIGALTDDAAFYLRDCIEAGNTYQAIIKSVQTKHVTVFIREVNRVTAYKDSPTFLSF